LSADSDAAAYLAAIDNMARGKAMELPCGKLIIAALLFSLTAVASAQPAYYGGQDDLHDDRQRDNAYGHARIVRCESYDQRTNYCAADTRHGVRLLQRLSDAACMQGRSWGWNTRGIWVAHGCRGEFEVAWRGDPRRHDRYRAVRCESFDHRSRYCHADTRYGVRLLRRLSDASCVPGRSWGWNQRGIWVANGCRGEFEVRTRYRHEDRYPDYGQWLRCESLDGRYRACRANRHVRNAELLRELSRSDCDFNRSWGVRNGVVWVDRGCRAEFRIN
jgi:hypothetical protein